MTATERRTLADYLAMEYPFNVIADPDAGGYVIEFPDLPGCLTQVDTLDELPAMVEEVRALWIETTYELGQDVPMPSYPEEYSGRFNVRIPRSLHRNLVESAERDGVSLNQYVLTLLAQRDAQARVEAKLDALLAGESSAGQPARLAS
ncbi:MAG: toxin-antitoxin system HicB family antitoxin [Thermomicrobiales bacterium]